jgi:hypothetical protein
MSFSRVYQVCSVAQDLDISATQVLVLVLLAHHENAKSGRCFVGAETIALEGHMNEKTVRRALLSLKEKKLISTTPYGRTSLTTFHLPKVKPKVEEMEASYVGTQSPSGTQSPPTNEKSAGTQSPSGTQSPVADTFSGPQSPVRGPQSPTNQEVTRKEKRMESRTDQIRSDPVFLVPSCLGTEEGSGGEGSGEEIGGEGVEEERVGMEESRTDPIRSDQVFPVTSISEMQGEDPRTANVGDVEQEERTKRERTDLIGSDRALKVSHISQEKETEDPRTGEETTGKGEVIRPTHPVAIAFLERVGSTSKLETQGPHWDAIALHLQEQSPEIDFLAVIDWIWTDRDPFWRDQFARRRSDPFVHFEARITTILDQFVRATQPLKKKEKINDTDSIVVEHFR